MFHDLGIEALRKYVGIEEMGIRILADGSVYNLID
jgi:hypothetical protein